VAAAGFELAGTECNSVHVTLPATTENLTEVLGELHDRFGIEADLSLTPTGANLVLWVPAAEPNEAPPPPPTTNRLQLLGGLLLGAAAIGWANVALPTVLPTVSTTAPPLPSNWSSYIWAW